MLGWLADARKREKEPIAEKRSSRTLCAFCVFRLQNGANAYNGTRANCSTFNRSLAIESFALAMLSDTAFSTKQFGALLHMHESHSIL